MVDFYQEGDFLINNADAEEHQHMQELGISTNVTTKEDSFQLKIAALSFQITLITKYTLEQVNSEQFLFIIMKDFCTDKASTDSNTNIRMISSTLQNSLLSIVNRYILMHPDYFFNYLLSTFNLPSLEIFYGHYFRNMDYLTSRTATRINAVTLASLLPVIPKHISMESNNFMKYLFLAIKHIVPEV